MWRAITVILLLSSKMASGNIVDRAILEIGRKVYTQRNFEAYNYLVVALFFNHKSEPDNLINAKNWSVKLEEYKNEMLIDGLFEQDAQRLGSLVPNSDMLNAALKRVGANTTSSSWLKRYTLQKSFVEAELRQQMAIILKVQAYLRSRDRNQNTRGWKIRIDPQWAWFKRINSSMMYRFYEGAKNYHSLVKF